MSRPAPPSPELPNSIPDDGCGLPTAADLARLAPASLFGLSGRVVVVTGAAGGLGQWMAVGFAAAGARVIISDVAADPLHDLARRLAEAGADVEPVVADLSKGDAPQAIVSAAVERFGSVDVLVNNAAVNRRVPILDVGADLLEWIWTINFRQPYLLAQACARVMVPRGAGAVINIGSINSQVGIEDLSLYAPTKAALSQFTRVAAVEWARHGIRVNAVAPGFFATPMNVGHWIHETRAPWIMDRIPMCRPGTPPELVGICLLLASDAGSYITGQTFVVDGGFTTGSSWNVLPGAGLEAYRQHGGFAPPTGSRAPERLPA